MLDSLLTRRRVLRVGLASTLLATGGLLSGCGERSPRLLAGRGTLPSAWLSRLPGPWRLESLTEDDPAAIRSALLGPASRRPALVQLSDGWAGGLNPAALQPLGTPALYERLDPVHRQLDGLFGDAAPSRLAYPVSYSPWVLLLRNRPDLLRRREEGWNLLLDPGLRGRLVLPASPRVCIALVQGDPVRLKALRGQALAYDDRDALSLLLAGEAEAAVVPRQRVVPLLRRDPRLAVLLPQEGSPLTWTLLLNAAGSPQAPLPWLADLLDAGLLRKLLPAGWVPPVRRETLEPIVADLPGQLRDLLLPPAAVLDRCTTLLPLPEMERQRLQRLWEAAAAPV